MTSELFLNHGWWWPRYENKPEASYRFIQKMLPDLDVGLKFCKRRRRAIQAGGNIGFWPLRIADAGFEWVHTFEADPLTAQALHRNTGKDHRVVVRSVGLSDKPGYLQLKRGPNPGRTKLDTEGTIMVAVDTIDDYGFTDVDFIQLDLEGHEPQALRGAMNTIMLCRPVIMCETMGPSTDAVRSFMRMAKYEARARIHLDTVYLPV